MFSLFHSLFKKKSLHSPDTVSLKTMVHTREVGYKPYIELELTDHPLSIEQKNGIKLDRIREIAEEICAQNNEEIND
ncbi:DUF2199 domain-containing protein [Bacillus hominis]|uniref:DUF2199 domain-containing protein n=1 Tax=Bacillus hominis TaxID=2817478 RepID=UPI003F68ACC4